MWELRREKQNYNGLNIEDWKGQVREEIIMGTVARQKREEEEIIKVKITYFRKIRIMLR